MNSGFIASWSRFSHKCFSMIKGNNLEKFLWVLVIATESYITTYDSDSDEYNFGIPFLVNGRERSSSCDFLGIAQYLNFSTSAKYRTYIIYTMFDGLRSLEWKAGKSDSVILSFPNQTEDTHTIGNLGIGSYQCGFRAGKSTTYQFFTREYQIDYRH